MSLSLTQKQGIQPELREHFVTDGAVGVPLFVPVNAVAAADDIEANVVGLLADGDTCTVTVPNVAPYVFTFDAASVVADLEFRDAVELAALINAIPGVTAVENAGVVEMEATAGGLFGNGITVSVGYLADTTAGGGAGAPGVAQITAADIAELAIGDTITFDGNVYTMAAATSVPDREFQNTAGIAACIDAEADWGAAVAVTDVDITSAANGAIWNGFTVVLNYNRDFAGGVDGTPAVAGAITIAGGRIYYSTTSGGAENAGWQRSDVINFATF